MRTLRDFLLAEAMLNEKKEEKPIPPGYAKASTGGGLTKSGVQILKQLSGDEGAKYSDIKYSDVTVEHIRSASGADVSKINDLKDLCLKGILKGNSDGAKTMRQLFRKVDYAARENPGTDGFVITLHSDWGKLADAPKSSQKLIMFWVNALYNVYVENKIEAVKLRYYFSNDSFIVQEP